MSSDEQKNPDAAMKHTHVIKMASEKEKRAGLPGPDQQNITETTPGEGWVPPEGYVPQGTAQPGVIRVWLGMTIYRSIVDLTMTCIMREIITSGSPQYKAFQTHYRHMSNDALVDRARSRLCQFFLYNALPEKSNEMCDVLMLVDADIVWPRGTIQYMAWKAWETQSIVGGLVSKRSRGDGLATQFCKEWEADFKAEKVTLDFGVDEIIPSYYVGSAFTAYPLSVLQDIHDNSPIPVTMRDGSIKVMTMPLTVQGFRPYFLPMLAESEFHEGNVDYLSEDWAICKRARDLGHKVHATTLPWLRHYGNHGFTPKDALTKDGSASTDVMKKV